MKFLAFIGRSAIVALYIAGCAFTVGWLLNYNFDYATVMAVAFAASAVTRL